MRQDVRNVAMLRQDVRNVATQVRTQTTYGTQNIRRLGQDTTPADQTQDPFLLMQNNPPGTANLQGPINPPGPVIIPAQSQAAHPLGILGKPLGMQHALANLQSPINASGPRNIPAQNQAAPPMAILGTPLGMQHAPVADIPGAAAQIADHPGFEYLSMARWVPRAVSDLSPIREFFRNIPYVF